MGVAPRPFEVPAPGGGWGRHTGLATTLAIPRGPVTLRDRKCLETTESGTAPGLDLPQELPEQWTNTKKLAIQAKQNVAPLQANEVNILRRKCQQFEVVPSRGAGPAPSTWPGWGG